MFPHLKSERDRFAFGGIAHNSMANQILFNLPLYNYTWLNLKLHDRQVPLALRTLEGKHLRKKQGQHRLSVERNFDMP